MVASRIRSGNGRWDVATLTLVLANALQGCSGQPGVDAGGVSSPSPTSSANPEPTPPPNGSNEPMSPVAPPDERAREIRIREVAIYQAVKIPLMKDGEPVIARNAPVVLGKAAFLRVFVQPTPHFTPREIEAVLTLRSAESSAPPWVVRQHISGESKDEVLGSTINFDLPSTSITPELQWSVTLREREPATAAGTIDDGARYPAAPNEFDGLQPRYAGPLHVKLVPYRYKADGSARVPDLSEDQLRRYRAYLSAYYPFNEVVFEVHEPVDYEHAIGPASGWDELLDFHCDLRARERPDPKWLYYGVIVPTITALHYDDEGLVGLSFIPGPDANYGRCAVGLGFSGGQAGFIMSHELGHALGLPHAPCGISEAEPSPYPYSEGKIGSWGFVFESRTLRDPEHHYDLMGYCSPSFISDYNYEKLFQRVRYLNLQAAQQQQQQPPGSFQAYVRVRQHDDGRRVVVGREHLARPPGGEQELREVRLFDEQGARLESSRESYFIPTSAGGAGTWFVPDVGAHSVEFQPLGLRRIERSGSFEKAQRLKL